MQAIYIYNIIHVWHNSIVIDNNNNINFVQKKMKTIYMNIIKNVLLIFVFLFVSIVIGIPGIETNNLIKSKIYLFGGVMIFQLLLKSMYKLRYRCKTNLKSLINDSIITAILCVVGFSIFVDLINMEGTRDMIVPYLENKNTQALIISSIISSFVLSAKVVEIIITGKRDECEID